MPARLHHKFLPVTGSTSCRNVDVVNLGFGIASRQQFVWAPMAIHARSRLAIARFDRFRMEAAVVGSLLVSVAGGAGNFGRRGLMGRVLEVRVAVHALEHAAVHRVLKLIGAHVKTYRLAIDLMVEAGIPVAGQAIVVVGLGSGLVTGSREAYTECADTQCQNRDVSYPWANPAKARSGSWHRV